MANKLDNCSPAYRDDFLYALDNQLILNWYPERILHYAKGESLLELGVGHGYSTVRFARHFRKHVVIDGSPEIIQQFHSNYPDCSVEIIESYFETFETKETFDVIVMGFILEHVADPGLILSRYRQFLKPGGSMFLTVPNSEALNRRLGHQAGLLPDLLQLSEGDIALGHQRLFTVETLSELVKDHGYRSISIEGLFLKPITTKQIQQLELSEEILQAMLKVGIHYPELCAGILMEIKDEYATI